MVSGWSNFYVMTGSAAAALIGLMFVVITLVTRTENLERTQDGVATFSTPTVMHFCAVLLISAVLLAPWRGLIHPAIATAFIGLGGIVYAARTVYRAKRLTRYELDLDDWAWYGVVPFVAYGALFAGAVALALLPAEGALLIAASVVLMIFIGIRNAWDVVTFLAVR